MENPRQRIEDRAANFLQRRDSGEWSEADQVELTAWLEASTGHRVAFLRTEAAWEEMGRLKAVGAGLPRRKVPTPEELNATHFFADRPGATSPALVEGPAQRESEVVPDDARIHSFQSSPGERRRKVPARAGRERSLGREIGGKVVLAASVLLATGIALGSYQLWFTGERYTTPVGGVAIVPLQDGSRITLNTRSKVRVVLSEKERHIDLSQGEAFFEVAHDKNRPFVVQAGGKRVIAVGTQFSVRREGDDIRVVVTEGTVRLESAGSLLRLEADGLGVRAPNPTAPREGRGGGTGDTQVDARVTLSSGEREVLASAGTIARLGASGISIEQEPPAEAEEMLSWRSGYVVFHETPLADAIAEFNRYNTHQIIIQAPAVAAMPLTGKFRATNNEAFVNLLEQTYHIHAHRAPNEIVLTDTTQP
jgi:transmembrane sensor